MNSSDPSSPEGIQTPLWEHQRRALEFCASRSACMAALDLGCGKSLVAIANVQQRGAQRVLITCPLSVLPVWPREFALHSAWPWKVVTLGKGTVRAKAAEAKRQVELARVRGQPIAVVVNHESLWRKPFGEFVHGTAWDTLICDESHRGKMPSGKLSLFLSSLRPRIPVRMALTGTPMPHSPLDIYAQFRFLSTGIYGTSYHRFKQRYAVLGGYEKKQVVGFRNLAELEEKFQRLAIRILKADALDLPPEVHVERTFDLNDTSRRIYEDLEREFVSRIESGKITPANGLVALLRMEQICSGFVTTDDDRLGVLGHEKERLLEDLLEDLSLPVVVFCRFHHDLGAVHAVTGRLGLRGGEISGRRKDVSPEGRFPDGVDVLACQIQSGGVGIDLSKASTAIYYSTGWSLGDVLQSMGRLHRPGQKADKVTYIHLQAANTVEGKRLRALRRRQDLVEAVIAGVHRKES